MNFWDLIRDEIKAQETTQEWVAAKAGVSFDTLRGWIAKNRLPRLDEAKAIADALGLSLDALVKGKAEHAHAPSGREVSIEGDTVPVPIYNQKVAAGRGKMMLESAEIVGKLPFLAKMLRGIDPSRACAVEAQGDSMTGIGLFGGDMVVFVPGFVDGEGVYVLRVDEKLLVKRIQFRQDEGKVLVLSENKSYTPMSFPANSERLELVGKVLGWVHAHPY